MMRITAKNVCNGYSWNYMEEYREFDGLWGVATWT